LFNCQILLQPSNLAWSLKEKFWEILQQGHTSFLSPNQQCQSSESFVCSISAAAMFSLCHFIAALALHAITCIQTKMLVPLTGYEKLKYVKDMTITDVDLLQSDQ